MVEILADKVKLNVREREAVTSGSVNVYPVRFQFSEDWSGLEKTAIFRAGAESRAVTLDESQPPIPDIWQQKLDAKGDKGNPGEQGPVGPAGP